MNRDQNSSAAARTSLRLTAPTLALKVFGRTTRVEQWRPGAGADADGPCLDQPHFNALVLIQFSQVV